MQMTPTIGIDWATGPDTTVAYREYRAERMVIEVDVAQPAVVTETEIRDHLRRRILGKASLDLEEENRQRYEEWRQRMYAAHSWPFDGDLLESRPERYVPVVGPVDVQPLLHDPLVKPWLRRYRGLAWVFPRVQHADVAHVERAFQGADPLHRVLRVVVWPPATWRSVMVPLQQPVRVRYPLTRAEHCRQQQAAARRRQRRRGQHRG